MMTLVPASPRALAELAELERPPGLSWRPHPDPAAAAVVVESHTTAADRVARELAGRHGSRFWAHGRWHTRRVQLTLPGLAF